jgi:spermidine synthase
MPNVEITQQKGYNFLWIDGHMWMWDLPFEVDIQRNMAELCHGRVVVVGLGLAVIQKLLANNPRVDEVLTIEKHKEVYDCCRKHSIITDEDINKIGGVFVCDWFDAICGEEECEKYDFVIGDIWPEIDPKQLYSYFRFQKKAKEFLKPSGQILAWGKDYYEYCLQRSYDYCISSDGLFWHRKGEDV